MKKIFLMLVVLIGFAFAAKAQSVDVYDVVPNGDGTIEVTVKVWGSGSKTDDYRVKVTPTEKQRGAVVEAAKFVNVKANETGNTAKVTFNCSETKIGGDAEMCKQYFFKAELVRY